VPYVRQYTEDRELSAWFLLDLSGSVDFGSADRTKLAVSAAFVATLARVLTRHGNRVGALLYSQQVDSLLKPASTRLHVLNLLTRVRTRPARSPSKPTATTSLADLLLTAERSIQRRSLVFVVSDFISTPGWPEALARLTRRHEVIAVRLYDPVEMKLPDVGLVTLEDAETGEQLFVDSNDAGFRQRYEQLAAEREAQVMDALARSGADTLELSTDDDLLDALQRFVDLRRRRARLKAPTRFPAHFKPTNATNATAATAEGAVL
jgi:uncharacterized protein (DUF58 family)